MRVMKLFSACIMASAMASAADASAQVQTIVPGPVPDAKPVAVEHIKIHGTALEGNLEGDTVDRDVIVFLPPGYQKDTKRRYPVVYALHGYSIGAEQWTHEIHVPQTIEGAFATGSQEMIVVLPDSKTIYNGSMYSSSVTTGDFEKFVWHDVVAYIDTHYRTIAQRTSRGLVGHSMGGYGASRIGMKHSEVFGALYIMSPCCMSSMAGGGPGSCRSSKREGHCQREESFGGQVPGRTGRTVARLCRCPVCNRCSMGSQPKKSSALLRPANQRRRSAARCRREIFGQLALGPCRSVHRQFQAVPRYCHRRRRPGRPAL